MQTINTDTSISITNNSAQKLSDDFIYSMDIKPSSRRVYQKCLKQYFRFIEETGRNLDELTRNDIIAYKDHLFSSEQYRRSELTISLYICTVRLFYAWTESQHLYPNIARGIKNPRRRQSAFKKMHLTSQQGEQYLENFKYADNPAPDTADNGKTKHRHFTNIQSMSLRDAAIMTLMLYCGLRTIEVTRLDVEDITFHLGQRVLRIQGKGHDVKDAYVVLIDEAWKPLEQYLHTRKGALAGEPLFLCEGYGRKGKRISTRRIQAICKEGMRAIGLDSHEYSAHSLRHTTGVMIVKNGGSLLDVKTVLRHVSTATSQIYVESALEELRISSAPENKLVGCFRKAN